MFYTVTKDGEPVHDLKAGDEIKVTTLFCMATMIVEKNEHGSLTAISKNGKLGAFLDKNKENGYYESNSSFDPNAIFKVQII
jgi:hypothetical protein